MEKMPCSIFNDVIGPVMRGPSSSHVAGAERIASLVRQSFEAPIVRAVVDFDVHGALAASHTGHGTDMGFACGLMGLPITDHRVGQYETLAKEAGIDIEYRILDYGAKHPGNYRMEIFSADGRCRHWEAISVGGGMIKLEKLEQFDVDICGDFYELLAVVKQTGGAVAERIKNISECFAESEYCLMCERDTETLLNWKFKAPLDKAAIQKVKALADDVIVLEPILPIHSRAGISVPFENCEQLLEFAQTHEYEAWEYAALYESIRGGINTGEVYEKMRALLKIMEAAVDNGLSGTSYKDRILGPQASGIDKRRERLVPCRPLNEVIQCITAVMETKSAMGVIIAAPTCGSCGCLPGTVIGLARSLGLSEDTMIQGLLTAGLVGVFFAGEATFSAEVAGCQVECGAGSGMAAAAVASMLGGTVSECMDAASVALQNITGLACDPVANRVEVPCLGKNVMGGSNAVSSANMILAGYDKVIPLDETIKAIYEIGLSMPLELRCTFGGLGKTKTALDLLKKAENHFEEQEE